MTMPLDTTARRSSNAVNAYQQTSARVETPRQVDAMVLLDSADRLERLKKSRATADAEGTQPSAENAAEDDKAYEAVLLRNRLIWTVIMSEMTKDHPWPLEVKANIVNLGLFVDVQTAKAIGSKDVGLLDALININRNIAAGLLAQEQASAPAREAAPAAE